MQNEIWKPVVGYEGLYEVSNFGNVKRLEKLVKHAKGGLSRIKEKILLQSKDRRGYNRLVLTKENHQTHRVHTIVAKAFIENVDNKPIVNHIDGNKINNKVDNLEWVTKSENELHAYRIGLKKSGNIGSKCHWAKFTKEQIIEIRKEYKPTRNSIGDLAKKYGVKWDTISNIVKGKTYAE